MNNVNRYGQSIQRTSDLSVEELWTRVVQIEKWPLYTASITSAKILGDGSLVMGSRIVINQPGAPEATWTVTELAEGKSFTYEMRRAGLVSIAEHVVDAHGENGSILTLTFSMHGRFAAIWALLMGKKIREYLQLEAEGLTKNS